MWMLVNVSVIVCSKPDLHAITTLSKQFQDTNKYLLQLQIQLFKHVDVNRNKLWPSATWSHWIMIMDDDN